MGIENNSMTGQFYALSISPDGTKMFYAQNNDLKSFIFYLIVLKKKKTKKK
jgi:hypothetical protein